MAIAYDSYGTSNGGSNITITLPSDDNLAVLLVWHYEDAGAGAGGPPTVPSGATATLVTTADFFRGARSYIVTGLSSGSNTFGFPRSGGNQMALAIVMTGVDQTTPVEDATLTDTSYSSGQVITMDTDDSDELGIIVIGSPTSNVTVAGTSGTTYGGKSAVGSYGGTLDFGYEATAGTTVGLALTKTGGSHQAIGYSFNPSTGGGAEPLNNKIMSVV